MTYEQAKRLPMRELRDLAQRLPRLEARDDLRLLSITTYPHWSGDSKNHKSAAREGNRMRKKFARQLERTARGLGPFDPVDGVDVIPEDNVGQGLRQWFAAHGINAAA